MQYHVLFLIQNLKEHGLENRKTVSYPEKICYKLGDGSINYYLAEYDILQLFTNQSHAKFYHNNPEVPQTVAKSATLA